MFPKMRGLDEFAIQPVGDEVVVFDPVSMQYHTLNQSAFRVWRYSDGSRSLGEIAVDAFGEETPTTMHLVSYGLQELEQAGFLDADVLISRRSALRLGISVVAGAGVLPTILSISVPVAAQGLSPFPTPIGEYGRCPFGAGYAVCDVGFCCCYALASGHEVSYCRHESECTGPLACG